MDVRRDVHRAETKPKHLLLTLTCVDVVVVRWPDEQPRLERLRSAGTPRLLLVAPEAPPPVPLDPLEDWVRLPADDRDLRAHGLVGHPEMLSRPTPRRVAGR